MSAERPTMSYVTMAAAWWAAATKIDRRAR